MTTRLQPGRQSSHGERTGVRRDKGAGIAQGETAAGITVVPRRFARIPVWNIR
jgi:hypothetical protein